MLVFDEVFVRTKNSVINILTNCSCYLFLIITSFFIRRAFSQVFGLELVGVDGAFLNTISILSVVELGLGTGMVYKLYKPIAENDEKKIALILKFMRNAYATISLIILFFGLISAFFSVNAIKESFSKTWLSKIFIFYIFDMLASYLFFHKRAMFIASQKNYLNNLIKIFVIFITFFVQIFIIYFLKSFEIYLIIKIISRVAENILISYFFDKKYKFLDIRNASNFSEIEKKEILNSIKGMLFHKIGGAGLKQISGIIALMFISMRENGIYYNYMMIITAIWGISAEFFNGISASFGDLLSTENKEKIYENFKALFFINFLIYSLFISIFYNVISYFMTFWIGDSIFSVNNNMLISIYIYVYGIKQCIDMVKSSAGIYSPDRFYPILESVVNFALSFFLAKKFGINGVFAGAILSTLLVPLFSQPFFLYKIVFKKSIFNYYKKYLIYALVSFSNVIVSHFAVTFINLNSLILKILLNSFVCLSFSVMINLLLFNKNEEFKFIKQRARFLIR